MNTLDAALTLASLGFYVFPLAENSKFPNIDGWQRKASRDPERIRGWWTDPVLGTIQPWNVGIATGRFGDTGALLVIDVDDKRGKSGSASLVALEKVEGPLPLTLTQTTPSGGRHLIYAVPQAVKQGVDVLGSGLDVRSRGGYIVAVGSTLDGKRYAAQFNDGVAPAPQWLIDKCGVEHDTPKPKAAAPDAVNTAYALRRAQEYLVESAPLAIEGSGGDATTFKVAARLRDIGISEAEALLLLAEHWNPRCSPPWELPDLETKVRNAYAYARDNAASAAPESDFTPIKLADGGTDSRNDGGFLGRLNREYAFVLAGGGHHVLWETTDHHNRPSLVHLSESSFHKKFAAQKVRVGKRDELITQQWMESPSRRSYDGLCFMPGQQGPARFYNMWRGFAVSPVAEKDASAEGKRAVDAWFEHALKNVSQGSEELNTWLLTFFAHLVQRPWEKPLVAPVLRGGKGVGKNALLELGVNRILGSHANVVQDGRYLMSNFNGHMEALLLLTFDEAFWSGDKRSEAILKGLITSKTQMIEHKGKEPYEVENHLRIVVLSNEHWAVPSSGDERRFAVYDVGNARRGDRPFFEMMRKGMEADGAGLLLTRLLAYPLPDLFPKAPDTEGLTDQKVASSDPLQRWWFECLTVGRIVGSEFGTDWPERIGREALREAYSQYQRQHRISSRDVDLRWFGRKLRQMAPGLKDAKVDGGRHGIALGALADRRAEMAQYMQTVVNWDE